MAGKRGFSAGKNGEENADLISVFIPGISAEICSGDCIIREKTDDTDRVINRGKTVMNVTVCDYGSENMRHIELEVK